MTKQLLKVTNQVPVSLDPNYGSLIKIKQNGNPYNLVKENMAKNLFTNSNTEIKLLSKNKSLSSDDITQVFLNCLDKVIDPKNEKLAKTILASTALDYQKSSNLLFKECYAQMAAERQKMPLPSVQAVYTINTDVIPNTKKFLAGKTSIDTVFASYAFTFKTNTLGVAFKNEQDFNDFKKLVWVYSQNHKLPSDTINKIRDFQKEKLDGLTDNLLLRNNDSDDQQPLSFSRLLMKMFFASPDAYIMPFDMGELYDPHALIIINLDQHAHGSVSEIKQNWKSIRNATSINKLKILNNHHLFHLPTVSRSTAINKHLHSIQSNVNTLARAQMRPLSKTRPSNMYLIKLIAKIIDRLGRVNQSSNTYTIKHRTFNRANRRHPDDYNLPGRASITVYKPDLHIYLDTSGSISEENYQSGIKACIALAKKLNVDMYFNSFSHYLSPCYKLPLKGLSLKQIYAMFELIPKVDGGTEYSNIWHYINHNKARQKEFSLIITDFEYYPPTEHFVHPKNLYYAPIDNTDFSYISQDATDFVKAMAATGHYIRNKILF